MNGLKEEVYKRNTVENFVRQTKEESIQIDEMQIERRIRGNYSNVSECTKEKLKGSL